MELNYFICLITFTMLAVLQAWLINGIVTASAGETEKLPDGTDLDSEMIFYPIKKELTRTKPKRIWYNVEYFTKLWQELLRKFPDPMKEQVQREGLERQRLWGQTKDEHKFWEEAVKTINPSNRIEWDDNGVGSVYMEIEAKVYSKWIRKPLIECVKCMASFWSGVTYWPLVLCVYGFEWWQIPVFIADMMVVCFLSWFFYKTVL